MRSPLYNIAANDSIRRVVEQLFVKNAHFGPQSDTLLMAKPPVMAADIYGVEAKLHAPAASVHSIPMLSENPIIQGSVVVITLILALLIYQYWADIRSVFSYASINKPLSGDSALRNGNKHDVFLTTSGILGVLMAGILVVKCVDVLMPAGFIPYAMAPVVVIATAIALLLLGLFQTGLMYIIGIITLTHEFTSDIIRLKRITLSFATLVMGPILLLYALCPKNTGTVLMYTIVIVIVISTVLFVIKTLFFFVGKKISILHWFLYLCAVEIFPVSLLCLLALRHQ